MVRYIRFGFINNLHKFQRSARRRCKIKVTGFQILPLLAAWWRCSRRWKRTNHTTMWTLFFGVGCAMRTEANGIFRSCRICSIRLTQTQHSESTTYVCIWFASPVDSLQHSDCTIYKHLITTLTAWFAGSLRWYQLLTDRNKFYLQNCLSILL